MVIDSLSTCIHTIVFHTTICVKAPSALAYGASTIANEAAFTEELWFRSSVPNGASCVSSSGLIDC